MKGETDMIDKNDSLKIALILWSRSATQGMYSYVCTHWEILQV